MRSKKHRLGNSSLTFETPVPFGMLVWSTGLAPNPLIKTIKDLKHDARTLRQVGTLPDWSLALIFPQSRG